MLIKSTLKSIVFLLGIIQITNARFFTGAIIKRPKYGAVTANAKICAEIGWYKIMIKLNFK